MKDTELSSIIGSIEEVFKIILNEYGEFLRKNKKIDLISSIDYQNFFQIINEANMPPVYYLDNRCILNLHFFQNNIDIKKLIPFLCLMFLCGNINPLKLGLIEKEVERLSRKYNLKIMNINEKELEVANIVFDAFLSDIPFNIIFLDSNVDIIAYLVEEKGSKIALLYHQISNLMQYKYKELKDYSFNNYINFYNNLDYRDVIDLIYSFISSKVRQ